MTGKEVDFVVEQGRRLVAIEVKLSSNLHYDDTEGLRLFLEEYPETVTGVLLYAGNKIRYFHEKIVAVPWRLLAGG